MSELPFDKLCRYPYDCRARLEYHLMRVPADYKLCEGEKFLGWVVPDKMMRELWELKLTMKNIGKIKKTNETR